MRGDYNEGIYNEGIWIGDAQEGRRGGLVAAEDVAGVDAIGHIGKCLLVEAVGDYGFGTPLEFVEVVDYFAAEEQCAVFQCRLVDYHLGTLRLDTLHDALDGRLTEIV